MSLLSGFGGSTIRANVTLPRNSAAGCYQLVAVIGGATVSRNCAFKMNAQTQTIDKVPTMNLWGLALLCITVAGLGVISKRRWYRR